jgi:AcrR family transcriptional regulator
MSDALQPRWRRLPQERPTQILDAALEVFGEKGLAAARLDDIAKRAGLAKGTIYLYFPNTEALFCEVIRQTVVSQIESGERAFEAATTSATASLERHMRQHWAFIRSPTFAPIFRLIHAELSQHPDLARFYSDEVITRGHRLTASIISRGIAAGEFRQADPLVAARMLSAPFVMHGIWCRHRDAFTWMAEKSDDEVLEELIQFNLNALCVKPAPKRRARALSTR